jgi:threonine dehydratase
VVLLISGGNLDLQWMDRIVQRGTVALGRRMRLKVVIPDRPGSLFGVVEIIARHRANILQVYHERMAPEQPVHLSRVQFDLEVEGREHGGEILHALREAGIEVAG